MASISVNFPLENIIEPSENFPQYAIVANLVDN